MKEEKFFALKLRLIIHLLIIGELFSSLFLSFSCQTHSPSFIILCAGDSLTEEGYPVHLRRLLQQQGIRARIHNRGRRGHNSTEYLAYLMAREDELRSLTPDFILLELGTNDVRLDGDQTSVDVFEKNMREIIGIFSRFRDRWGRSPRLFLALIPPIPPGVAYPFSQESNQRVEVEINPTISRLASEKGLVVVNHWAIFQVRPELLPDIHPNQEGYKAMAQAWAQALLPYLRR